MAYINRLSDINTKLNLSNENQLVTNSKLENIDENIETIRTLNTNINSTISNNALNVNIISDASSYQANLYNGTGTVAITSTEIDTKNGIDVNIIGGASSSSQANLYNGGGTIAITATAVDAKNGIDVNIIGGASSSSQANLYNGAGTVAITATAIDLVNAIDTNDIITQTRLTTINTSIGTTNTTLTSTNTKLDTINTSIGTTNTTLTSTNTKLDTINTSVGTVNTSIGTTNTTLTSTNTKLDTINTSVESVNTSIGTTNTTLTTINQGTGFNFQGNVYGNVCSNVTINANSFSTSFTWTRGTYGRNSILSYFDTSTANTDSISIFTTATNGNSLYLGTAYPINIGNATGRYYCFTLNLLPYNSIRIRNNSSSNITGVDATLTSA